MLHSFVEFPVMVTTEDGVRKKRKNRGKISKYKLFLRACVWAAVIVNVET